MSTGRNCRVCARNFARTRQTKFRQKKMEMACLGMK